LATGLIALLDDVAGIAKVAAASLDDVTVHATRAGAKAAGVVIDDAAVTPRYVTGFAAARELPIIGRIALGSLKNKLLYLLPAALVLSLFAPWAITPLLMLGGLYLCYEGTEKVYEALFPHGAHRHESAVRAPGRDAKAVENEKVRAAIATDFILSAEIMAIALATLPEAPFWEQGLVLAAVGTGITGLVYGAVALIVKADDAGVALAQNDRPVSGLADLFRRGTGSSEPGAADRLVRPATRALGRGLVYGMPVLLRILGVIGTAAMIWVGGGIVIHGLEEYGLAALAHSIHAAAEAAAHALPPLAGPVEWIVAAAAAGLFGLALGAVTIPLVQYVVSPVLKRLPGRRTAASHASGGRTES
jgi:predicted DNA repair protein MutK